MALKETYIDKLLQQDNVSAVRRLVIGGLLAASAPFGIVPIAMMSVASIGINAVVMSHEKKIQHKKLLNFYEDEIATLQHKPVNALTLDDLKQVAAPVSEGGKGITTLRHELDELNTQQTFRIGSAAVSSVITGGILIGLCAIPGFLGAGFMTILGLGLIGVGHSIIAKTVKTTIQTLFGSHETEDMVNQRLMRIGEEIKEKPANPVEIFGLFVDANPTLAMQVQQNFGMEYADLPVVQKKQVVEAYEPQLRTIALTDAMNKGIIPASLVGLIASGDASDALPKYCKYRELFSEPLQKLSSPASFDLSAGDVKLADHRKRLDNERELLAKGSNRLLH